MRPPILVPLVLAIAVVFVSTARADTWTDAAHALAGEIVAKTGPGSLALDVQNQSSLSAGEAAQVRHALESELRADGIEFVPADRAVGEVRVTLSENQAGYLWVTDIRQGTTHDTVILPVARSGDMSAAHAAASLTIERQLLWRQDRPFVDLAVISDRGGSGAALLVLEADRIAYYRSIGGRWQLQHEEPIVTSAAASRDVRGRLVLRPDLISFDAWLPGRTCSGSYQPTLSVNCRAADDPWPLVAGDPASGAAFYGESRNFFSGVIVNGNQQRTVSPFYSAALLPVDSGSTWVFAGVDGRARWWTAASATPVELPDRWGSSLAGIGSACSSRHQLLVTSDGDWNEHDAIEAVEVLDRDLVAASAPLEFPGPVIELRTDAGGRTATAIVHNLQAGSYEAYSLSIACSQ